MKTVALRTLLREPLKIKRMTRGGRAVTVTDQGVPLWIIQPAGGNGADRKRRRRELEAELTSILGSPRSKLPLSRVVLDSRR
ncbi:MAG: hypothetical protein ABSH48_03335 [Verrucomicrobiota bacterium]|jgi:hypothetical protein